MAPPRLDRTSPGRTVSAVSSFSYDGVFNMLGFSANYGTGSTLPNGSRSFGYDTKDRLTSSSIPTSSTTTVSSTFGFDYAGNRTSVNSTTIPFNNDNQCSSSGNGFDGNGNPTTYNGTSLTFDPENRVTAIGSLNSATYRADGLRATKTVGSATTYYLYDGGEPIIELNSSGTVTAFNVFAPDGLVSRTAGSTTTEYVFDQQGNVADRTDTSGNVNSVTQYDAWGNEQIISGTDTDPFGYNAQSGYYLDRETGLYLCQHRLYDPGNGRWLNRDPIGYDGGTNLYGYCAGGPVGLVDTSGFSLENPANAILAGETMAELNGAGDGAAALANALRGAGVAGAALAPAVLSDPNFPSDAANALTGVCDAISSAGGGGDSNGGTPFDPNNQWDGQRPGQIPEDWGERPAKRGGGTHYYDPNNPHNSARIDPNNPAFGNPDEHHVNVIVNGQKIVLDPPDLGHIPYKDWKNWPNWYPQSRLPR